jgi:hypothetical protein
MDLFKLREVIMEEINNFHKKPKLNFNFKPVSKTELEKAQAKRIAKKTPPIITEAATQGIQTSINAHPSKTDVVMVSADASVKQDIEMLSAKLKAEAQEAAEASKASGMASLDTKARIIAALSSKRRHKNGLFWMCFVFVL